MSYLVPKTIHGISLEITCVHLKVSSWNDCASPNEKTSYSWTQCRIEKLLPSQLCILIQELESKPSLVTSVACRKELQLEKNSVDPKRSTIL